MYCTGCQRVWLTDPAQRYCRVCGELPRGRVCSFCDLPISEDAPVILGKPYCNVCTELRRAANKLSHRLSDGLASDDDD